MIENNNIAFAFILTMLAGLATGIGSCLAFFTHHTNKRFLSFSLGLSAGVMFFVSFIEIYPDATKMIEKVCHNKQGAGLITLVAFFAGMFIVALIDKLVPDIENPHTAHIVEDMEQKQEDKKTKNLMRMGLMSAIAIAIHNFPEGIATFASALHTPSLGISIAVAIAIHNIPEGIAVAVPIYYSTGSKKKAFLYSFLSGLAEPLGALIAFFFLRLFLNDLLLGIIFASVSGIMIFIALDELLPAAEEYGEHHICLYGVLSGMAIMAISLILFK